MRTIKRLLSRHRDFWNSERRQSLYVGILLLFLSFLVQFRTGRYAAKSATNFVGDLFLDNLPVIKLDFVIVEGGVIFALLVLALFCLKPRYSLFGIKALSLLVVSRAIFISFTHLGIYPRQISLDGWGFINTLYHAFDLGGDFFFSGHTAFPFMAALIFWPDKFWRYAFFGISVFFGAAALLAHVHYSIDVFAAPFIAYGIFIITKNIFGRDFSLRDDQ